MSDTISRQDAIDAECAVCIVTPKEEQGRNCDYYLRGCSEVECLRALPSAERKGHWIWKGEEGDSRFMCSVCYCKENVPTCNGEPTIWEFCPNCGARMVSEDAE